MELTLKEMAMLIDLERFMYGTLGNNLSLTKYQINQKLKEQLQSNPNGTINRAIEKFIQSGILMPDKENTWYYDDDNKKRVLKCGANIELTETIKKIYQKLL